LSSFSPTYARGLVLIIPRFDYVDSEIRLPHLIHGPLHMENTDRICTIWQQFVTLNTFIACGEIWSTRPCFPTSCTDRAARLFRKIFQRPGCNVANVLENIAHHYLRPCTKRDVFATQTRRILRTSFSNELSVAIFPERVSRSKNLLSISTNIENCLIAKSIIY